MHKKNGAAWPEKIRQKVGDAYEAVVGWVAERMEIDAEDAQDVVHEILPRLPNGRTLRIANIEHYLAKAAINEFKRSKVKREVLFSELSEDGEQVHLQIRAPGGNPADEAATNELLAILRAEIQKLPKRQREVMMLDLQERSDEEIKDILGLKSVASVRSHRRHAMAKLRKKIPMDE